MGFLNFVAILLTVLINPATPKSNFRVLCFVDMFKLISCSNWPSFIEIVGRRVKLVEVIYASHLGVKAYSFHLIFPAFKIRCNRTLMRYKFKCPGR
jgi:hypothetical protein